MSKRTDKKVAELHQAIEYAEKISTKLGYRGNVGTLQDSAKEFLTKMPKFKNYPKLKRSFTSTLNRVANGEWTPQMGAIIFRNEINKLYCQLRELS